MAEIVVTRALPGPALDLLRSCGECWVSPHERPLRPEELREAVAGARALVCLLQDMVDADLLAAAGPQLRVVANVAVGYDNVDLSSARRRGVVVTNTPGVLTDATADLTLALILMVTRRLGEAERLVRSGAPWAWDLSFMLGHDVRERLLGVVGLGAIGAAVARRARALGMSVVYAAPRPADPALAAELGAQRLELDELLSRADVVTLHCPLTDETRGLIDARALARMRSDAFLINTARGAVVDEAALVDALRDGSIAGAGLDVYRHEPELAPGLVELENVVLLPHLGSATVATRRAMAELAARNVCAVLSGAAPLTPVGVRPAT